MRHKASNSDGKFALLLLLCRHIDLLFGKRLDKNLLRHRIREYPDLPVHTLSDSLRIYFFHSREGILKRPDSLSNLPDARRSGKKKWRIQKYPDTCWRGVKSLSLSKTRPSTCSSARNFITEKYKNGCREDSSHSNLFASSSSVICFHANTKPRA